MKKKIVALCLVIALAATAVIGGTLAYFTDNDNATNTFTVGKVDIKLDEAKVDEYGDPVEPAERVQENSYKLIPACEYTKDPTVTVMAGSEESYIRMVVTVNKKAALDAIGVNALEVFQEYNAAKWPMDSQKADGDTMVYEFRYAETVSTVGTADKALEPLFTSILVPADITGEQLATLDGLVIDVDAHAIQAASFADADAAWAAFEN